MEIIDELYENCRGRVYCFELIVFTNLRIIFICKHHFKTTIIKDYRKVKLLKNF